MRQKDINEIRDRAVNASNSYSCADILTEAGYPTRKRGIQVYSKCYNCGSLDNKVSDKFSVNTSKNMYHCFGCNEGGGSVKLYSILNNVPYIDAALTLALRANKITQEEFEKASSTPDAIRKFKKGAGSIKKIEEVQAVDACVKAPAKICNIVYREMLKMPELALSNTHKEYLMNRNLSDEEIIKMKFFTYDKPFSIDKMVSNLKTKYNFDYTYLAGIPGFYFEKLSNGKGIWHFKAPMPNCVGIPLFDAFGNIVALQMRNLDAKTNLKNKYFYISSKYIEEKNKNYAFGCSPGSPVAVTYPEQVKIPSFYIGEGLFKMHEIAKEGIITFSVQGVNSLNYVVDEINNVLKISPKLNIADSIRGSEVQLVIVFDADMYEKIQVLEAGLRVATLFEKEFPGKTVRFLLWRKEYGKGFDDMKFNLLSQGLDYHNQIVAIRKSDFLDITKSAIKEADEVYKKRHPELADKDVKPSAVRTTSEYSILLNTYLYDKRISNILPAIKEKSA